MAYTTINKSSDHFNTVQWTGNGSTNAITGVGFQPDWVWGKSHTDGYSHQLYDVLRGATYSLKTNGATVQETLSSGLTSFDSDGFTLGSNTNINASGHTVTGWNWKAGGSGSSNSDGSISSTVSVNTTAGFSIATYAGTGASSGTATVGHGLGAVPKVVIQKRATGSGQNWHVYHSAVGNGSALILNDTQAANTQTDYWGDTTPTSSVVTIGPNNLSTGTNVLYSFVEKTGFSQFGSFKGNGSTDGPFIYTGFKPAWVMIKASSRSTDNWVIVDSKRSTSNVADSALLANTTGGIDTGYKRDFLSNGFKIRESGANQNGSGHTFTYLAFAEAPLVGSNDVPATAR
jgi:hypothetical protein